MNAWTTTMIRSRWFRVGLRGGVAGLLLAVTALASSPATASAQQGVDGPWLDIHQIFWFTAPDFDGTDPGETHTSNFTQRFDYGADRHPKCYYHEPDGPDAHQVNALYRMMSCRVGIVVGVLVWVGVAITLVALAWGGIMWVVDSGSGGDRLAALKNMLTGPVVALIILFCAYPISRAIYVLVRYNFQRYILGEGYWS